MTPLERAATALTATLRHHGVEMHPDDIRGLAIDAITSIREPSFDMMNAGRDAVLRTRRGGVSGMTIEAQTRNECIREIAAWQAMIDKALVEVE